MQKLHSNKNIYYVILFCVILLIILIAAAFSLQPKSNPSESAASSFAPSPTDVQLQSPTPIPPPETSDQYKQSVEKIHKSEEVFIAKESAVGRLLTQLPYKGQNFSIIKNYATAQFEVTLVKGKEKEGNEEFDAYLKLNGVENRNWIREELLIIK